MAETVQISHSCATFRLAKKLEVADQVGGSRAPLCWKLITLRTRNCGDGPSGFGLGFVRQPTSR